MKGRLSGLWLAIAGLNGAMAVAAGAYAAHGLATEGERTVTLFNTGSTYQMWHALALVGVALLARQPLSYAARLAVLLAGGAFTIGIVLFSGAVYRSALSGPDGFTALAPYGGSAMILGWLLLMAAGLLWLHRPAG